MEPEHDDASLKGPVVPLRFSGMQPRQPPLPHSKAERHSFVNFKSFGELSNSKVNAADFSFAEHGDEEEKEDSMEPVAIFAAN